LQRISQVFCRQILEIVVALKERNGEKSTACMEKHLKNAFEMLTKVI
jgi:DNA-binding GntR family transcriptional regulator